MDKIITISRQYGSGGRAIGKKVAEKYNIPFYDSELIMLAAKESGFSEEYFEDPEKNAGNSLLYSIVRGMQYQYRTATPWSLEETVYNTQSEIIRQIAEKGPCVIIGRCADYILRDYPNLVKVFICADMDFRMKRAVEVDNADPEKVKDIVKLKDKRRANYYNYHSDTKWGEADTKWGEAANYTICLNSSTCGIDKAVDVICSLL